MKKKIEFDDFFSAEYLKNVFSDNIVTSSSTGIDNLTSSNFEKNLDEHISVASRKIIAGTYNFTKYKLKLISKGRNKAPREISIPTIRDRIVLRALCNYLTKKHSEVVSFELPQDVVKRLKGAIFSGQFDAFIKLDVSNFYPSIRHDELVRRLHRRVRSENALTLVESAITTPTVVASKKEDPLSDIGVPQGLSISNILAAIYLLNVDKYLQKIPTACYFRYVDDILILCSKEYQAGLTDDLIRRFKRIGLQIHDPKKVPEKSSTGKIHERFSYLGYEFESNTVRARHGSIEKLKESLVSIFTSYKYSKTKSPGFLLWRLNLRITGCIFQEKRKGWLFFFSEINDESLLHRLDNYVDALTERFNVKINPKRFARTFYEIHHNIHQGHYIPNFDNFTIAMKREVLRDYFGLNLHGMPDVLIEIEFRKRISRQVKDLLTDIKDFS